MNTDFQLIQNQVILSLPQNITVEEKQNSDAPMDDSSPVSVSDNRIITLGYQYTGEDYQNKSHDSCQSDVATPLFHIDFEDTDFNMSKDEDLETQATPQWM